jgi:hypothetical protein
VRDLPACHVLNALTTMYEPLEMLEPELLPETIGGNRPPSGPLPSDSGLPFPPPTESTDPT